MAIFTFVRGNNIKNEPFYFSFYTVIIELTAYSRKQLGDKWAITLLKQLSTVPGL